MSQGRNISGTLVTVSYGSVLKGNEPDLAKLSGTMLGGAFGYGIGGYVGKNYSSVAGAVAGTFSADVTSYALGEILR